MGNDTHVPLEYSPGMILPPPPRKYATAPIDATKCNYE